MSPLPFNDHAVDKSTFYFNIQKIEKIDFLHFHSGYLPKYRGSTTIYYSILNNEKCGVTAILLNEKIDMGKIVGKKTYEKPLFGDDIDYLFDSSIRADLMIDVLTNYINNGFFSNTETQESTSGETYFVIHPLLKHFSILSLKNA